MATDENGTLTMQPSMRNKLARFVSRDFQSPNAMIATLIPTTSVQPTIPMLAKLAVKPTGCQTVNRQPALL